MLPDLVSLAPLVRAVDMRNLSKAAEQTHIALAAATQSQGGHVTSFARPGGNVTGVSMQRTEYTAKRVEILHEALPAAARDHPG